MAVACDAQCVAPTVPQGHIGKSHRIDRNRELPAQDSQPSGPAVFLSPDAEKCQVAVIIHVQELGGQSRAVVIAERPDRSNLDGIGPPRDNVRGRQYESWRNKIAGSARCAGKYLGDAVDLHWPSVERLPGNGLGRCDLQIASVEFWRQRQLDAVRG